MTTTPTGHIATDHPQPSGFVTSADGTRIAFDRAGSGPALILVDGAMCGRRFGPMPDLSKALQGSFTVYNYDRRGRGDSANTLPYSPEKEVDDLAAIIAEAGGRASVFGTSSGGGLVLRAAAAGADIERLAVYEVPYMVSTTRTPPSDMVGTLDRLVAAGDAAGAVKFFMVKMVGAPAFVPLMMRLMPKIWKQLLSAAPTLPNDARVMSAGSGAGVNGSAEFQPDLAGLAAITQPALVMRGGKSPQWMTDAVELVARTVPRSESRVLAGQTHQVTTAALAPAIIEYFGHPSHADTHHDDTEQRDTGRP